MWGTDKHIQGMLRIKIRWPQGGEKKVGLETSTGIKANKCYQAAVTSCSPSKLLTGSPLEGLPMSCAFQDPWGLALPICQAEEGTAGASPGRPRRRV